MNEEPIIHAELNLLPNYTQSSNIKHGYNSKELQLAKKMMKHHKCETQHRSQFTHAALRKENIQPTRLPGCTTEHKRDSDCHSCPEKWIGFQSNCYFISYKKETWGESRNFCISQNSKLFHQKSKDQLACLIGHVWGSLEGSIVDLGNSNVVLQDARLSNTMDEDEKDVCAVRQAGTRDRKT
ncbi:C-type lectin domain family 12 member B-like [Tenrec ecaudatus]|uniref:C-type lectin domain family 12 member B-like n=1 Tax=Tenrec ecaudatus TaxID=94439 RepID=UPI003F5A710A